MCLADKAKKSDIHKRKTVTPHFVSLIIEDLTERASAHVQNPAVNFR
jgi:hypothetical protein